ncbi:MAG: response regulator transcription factor [Parvibaculum sp.]
MSPSDSDRQSIDPAAPICRIIVTEDDDAVRERFVRLIADWDGGELAAECATLSDTLAAIRENEIDLLITDLNLPDGNGIEAIRALGVIQPRAEAMVISVLADDRTVLDSIEAGASGYLLKDADPVDLVEAINDLMAGRSPISSRIARVLVKRLAERTERTPEGNDAPKMTPREMDILWGIAKGLTSDELAASLGISRQTVPVHIRNIYRKLQVSNRSEAVFEATRQGIIRL